MLAARTFSAGCAFASLALFSHLISPASLGAYATATGFAGVILALNLVGADQLFLAGAISERALRPRAWRVAILTSLAAALVAFTVPLPSIETRAVVALVAVGGALQIAYQPSLLRPQRELLIAVRARREVALRLVTYGVLLAAVFLTRSILLGAGGFCAASLCFALAGFGRGRSPSHRIPPNLLRTGWWFACANAAYIFYFQIDTVILALLRPPAAVASYRLAYSLVIAARIIPLAMNNEVMRPMLYQPGLSRAARSRVLRWFGILSVSAGLVVSVSLLLVSPYVTKYLFGGHLPVQHLVTPLACAVPFSFAASYLMNILMAAGALRQLFAYNALLLVANVILNVLMISRYGAWGAAVSTVATEALSVVVFLPAVIGLTRKGACLSGLSSMAREAL